MRAAWEFAALAFSNPGRDGKQATNDRGKRGPAMKLERDDQRPAVSSRFKWKASDAELEVQLWVLCGFSPNGQNPGRTCAGRSAIQKELAVLALIEIGEVAGEPGAIGTVAGYGWMIGGDFRHLAGGIPLTHQLKEDPDYVSLIAGKKGKAGIGMNCHVPPQTEGFEFAMIRASTLR